MPLPASLNGFPLMGTLTVTPICDEETRKESRAAIAEARPDYNTYENVEKWSQNRL